jgi:hypothetical protein
VHYDIAQAVRVDLAAPDARAERDVRAALDPWGPTTEATTADVTIEQLREPPGHAELQNPAGDGLTTAWDGSHVYVRDRGRWCAVATPAADGPFTFAYEPGYALHRAFRQFIRPALQIAASARGVPAIHGTAVVADGRGVIVAGWAESGKTETALAFMEEGARFVSDKWTFAFPDGSIACFPVSVGIRRWMLRYAPTLRRALPRRALLQFRLAATASAATGMRLRQRGGVLAAAYDALDEVVSLADRAALSPTALSNVYGQPAPTDRAPLAAVIVLTTTADGEPRAELRDASWAAPRLARSASYERRGYLDLARRLRYVDAGMATDIADRVEQREERQLLALLERVPVVEAKAPFPCDPRRIVAAVRPFI